MNSIQKVEITNRTWFWMMGCLFTLGYVGGLESSGAWWKEVLWFVGTYILWPAILGLKLGGHI